MGCGIGLGPAPQPTWAGRTGPEAGRTVYSDRTREALAQEAMTRCRSDGHLTTRLRSWSSRVASMVGQAHCCERRNDTMVPPTLNKVVSELPTV